MLKTYKSGAKVQHFCKIDKFFNRKSNNFCKMSNRPCKNIQLLINKYQILRMVSKYRHKSIEIISEF